MIPNIFVYVLLISFASLVCCERKFKQKHLPSYITPCSASAANFTECIVKHGRESLPFLLKGDPKFKLPPLVPFYIDKVELTPNDKLSLILTDAQIYGIDTVDLKNASVDLKSRHVKIGLSAKSLKIMSKYNITGQILVLPISGEGLATFQFADCSFKYTLDFDLVKKGNGKNYVGDMRPKVSFEVANPNYQLDNLFNGNKELGDNTNKVLNENAQVVLKDFGLAISEIIGAVATRILSSFLTAIPYDEIFLP